MGFRPITEGAGQEILAQLNSAKQMLETGEEATVDSSSYTSKDWLTESTGRDISTALGEITALAKTQKEKLDEIEEGANNYELPLAADGTRGGVQTGYTSSGKNYAVQVDENEKAFVNVPWTNTDTTYSAATSSAEGLMSASDKTKLDGIDENANNYELPTATSTVLGGVMLGSDTTQTVDANSVTSTESRTYAVQANSSGQLVVNVPWDGGSYDLATETTDGLMSAEDKIKLNTIHTVTFVSDGSTHFVMYVFDGSSVNAPTNPTKDGYVFEGWSLTEDGELVTFPVTPTADINYYAVYTQVLVIGFNGMTEESGDLVWTDDISALQDSSAYTTSASGNYVSVTGALDGFFPFNGIEECTDDSGNSFIKFPQMWIKWVKDSNGYVDGIKISATQQDDDYFIPDAFLKSDGSGEYNDCFYMGKYEGSGSSSLVYSATGATPLVSITRANFRTGCRAYGSSDNYYNGYQQLDLSMYTLYNFLVMMYYRTQNIQTVYGGRTGSGSSTWSEASVTGTTDGVTGLNGWNISTDCVKMLGVENPYGNIYKWVDGIYFSSSTIYLHRYPSQYADSTTNGTTIGFSRPTSNGYISYLKTGTADTTKSCVYCYTASGSSSTYCGDYCYYNSSGTVLRVGGYWSSTASAGLWCLSGSYTASDTSTAVGGRLCLRPS